LINGASLTKSLVCAALVAGCSKIIDLIKIKST